MLVSFAYTHTQDSFGNDITRTTIVILQQAAALQVARPVWRSRCWRSEGIAREEENGCVSLSVQALEFPRVHHVSNTVCCYCDYRTTPLRK